MCVQIYRVSEKENSASFIHDEVCRSCASQFQNKGLSIEDWEIIKEKLKIDILK